MHDLFELPFHTCACVVLQLISHDRVYETICFYLEYHDYLNEFTKKSRKKTVLIRK